MKQLLPRWGPRAGGLLVTALGFYVVAPSVVALLGQWPHLRDVRPEWFVILVVLEACSWMCLWVPVHMLLPATPWPAVGSAQLAGLASGSVLPGGSATGGVVQASVLVRAGNAATQVAAALGSVGLLTTGMLLALPILTVPAVIIRPPPARQLQLGLVVSLIVAVVLVLLGLALLHWDSFVSFVGRVAGRGLHLVRRDVSVTDMADRVVAQRDQVAAAFAGRWGRALAAAAGSRMFDYAALVAAVYAVGGRARPSMVLLAYVLSLGLALVATSCALELDGVAPSQRVGERTKSSGRFLATKVLGLVYVEQIHVVSSVVTGGRGGHAPVHLGGRPRGSPASDEPR